MNTQLRNVRNQCKMYIATFKVRLSNFKNQSHNVRYKVTLGNINDNQKSCNFEN